jgi:hypothetical protein
MSANKLDMTPAVLDLILYAGDGATFQVDFVDETQQPIDLSGYIWTAQIRKTRTSDTAEDLEIETDQANVGVIMIHISDEVTRALQKTGQWDLQFTTPSRPEPLTVLQGTVTCNQDVTREDVAP